MYLAARRLFWRLVVAAGTALCLSSILSFGVTSLASAHANSCTFTLTSQGQSSISGYDGYGQISGTFTVSKFTDGCGHEYGVASVSFSRSVNITSGSTTVTGPNGSGQTTINWVGTVQTPVISGTGQICGSTSFNTSPMGGGGGGGCTPN